jgi:threonine aldolase
MIKRGFASDNNAGIHSLIMDELIKVNQGHTIAYGDDPYTEQAVRNLKNIFGEHTEVFFVFIGTAANVLGLDALTQPYHSIICAETAHIHTDECGAPEKFTGCKILSIDTDDGKITVEQIQKHVYGFGFEHHSQPKVISITQSTEMGTVYTPDEIKTICDFAHHHKMFVHMDGARITNAAESLGKVYKELTTDTGIDVLSFGGTKNGMMYGEAIIFFNKDLAQDFKFRRKQGMQLASKMRFISAQFNAYLRDNLCFKNAAHANRMALKLSEMARQVPCVRITRKVQSNAVFAIIPADIIAKLQKEYFFYVWDEDKNEVRWMTSFDTTDEDTEKFTQLLGELCRQRKDPSPRE